jgi:hypothetical protein
MCRYISHATFPEASLVLSCTLLRRGVMAVMMLLMLVVVVVVVKG